ncbi:hypothetical protein [Moorena sp. SIO3I6]|uniref:hypothetical protein n=1 Tax=Moorena sp. SIO3I6 TaxID=2607831 RepID=UPI0013FC08F8|nr:hypothetical protein [Moorena sp. SIO3I6]NEP23480.1 hypothetical protein [Moorena sp. SIO3I6]
MSNTLLVPINLDALCLANDQEVLDTMADYSLLPYKYQGETHGSGQANLSEQALAPLFNHQLTLEAGIHLHWSIPDALTTGTHNTFTTFPQVPNRWLIIRQGGDKGDKQWVLESDYLYPERPVEDNSPPPKAINILIDPPDVVDTDPDDASTYQYQRYRYMGKSWELGEWDSDDASKEYAAALTAVGTNANVPVLDHVKVTFAAFYPNSYSVFGFHDPDYPTETPGSGLQYDVVGWYSDGGQDCIQKFLEENSGVTDSEELLALLQEEFSWTIESGAAIPPQTIYHSRITFSGNGGSADLSQPNLAVGDSPAEALAAYLANSYPNKDQTIGGNSNNTIGKIVEEQLEALQILERLEFNKLDMYAKFRAGRHEVGFGTEKNGYLWSIMPQVSKNESDTTDTSSQNDLTLPDDLAQSLNELNIIQEQYNQAQLDIESLQRRLYSQWYLYMRDDPNFYGDVNDYSLVPLRTAMATAGEIEFSGQGTSTTVTAKTLPFEVVSRLSSYFNDYIAAIDQAVEGSYSNFSDYIKPEFRNCGIELSDNPTVSITNQGEANFYEGRAWNIEDGGQTYPVNVEGGIFTIYIPPTASQIAYNLVGAIRNLGSAIANYTTSTTQYRLCQVPSDNYWRPSDPFVLLTGDAAKASNRFGQDGRLREDGFLECYPIDFDVTNITNDVDGLLAKIDSLKPSSGEDSINFNTWSQQPWNPFAFQWNVLNYPSREMTGGVVQDYQPNQILDNYSLEPNAIDLQLKPGKESSFTPDGNSYKGFSILTPSAGEELSGQLTSYLNAQLLPTYYYQNNIPEDEQTPDYLSENFEAVKSWYEGTDDVQGMTEEQKAQDTIYVALWAYEQMEDLDCQAQTIGGFNDTIMLSQPTLSLEVDDPLTTNNTAKLVTDQVRWTLGDSSIQYEFLSGDIFNPIRSGGMTIDQLWLVDSYGRHFTVIDPDAGQADLVTSSRMTPPDNVDYQFLLAPRFAQNARLNFHWLAADAPSEIEMTTKPARNPVCGWIVPNNLDSTLSIYDQQGKTLGSLDRAGNWRPAPGGFGIPDVASISNPHLRKLVDYLLNQGQSFQQQFLSTLDNSLATIDPEGFALHSTLALLIGRPMAVVRATFSLEVKGLPVCDPTVKIESADQEVPTYGYTEVKVPIRLGDYQQLNDGLVGYWRETPVGTDGDYDYEGNIFYAPQSNLANDSLIQTEAEGLVYFEQTVDAPPQGVTMLIDPRGTIHATCGFLPNRELTLPSENYTTALQSMEVNFLATPMLCDRQTDMTIDIHDGEQLDPPAFDASSGLAIPVPQQANAVWSWVSLSGEEWSETTEIEGVNPTATFSEPQQLYEGWLQLSRAQEE